MHLIVLSGGSGQRLWPLSGGSNAKQMLQIFRNEDGKTESMVQRVQRLAQAETLVFAAPENQTGVLRQQLGAQIDLSVEPGSRDTFGAICLAAAYLRDKKGVDPEEPVVVIPSDSMTDENYFAMLPLLAEEAKRTRLVLMGIFPREPSEQYGYILPREDGTVSAFVEKPCKADAVKYIAMGALWNCGVFAFRISYILEKAKGLCGTDRYEELRRCYGELPKVSFDREVTERERDIRVLKYTGKWNDVGTWDSLCEELPEATAGNAVLDDDCRNVHVFNTLDIPVIGMGLKNLVISVTKDGILVSDKKASVHLKSCIKLLKKERRILFVHFHDLHDPSGGARRAFQNLTGCMKYGRCDTYQTGRKHSEVRSGLEHCLFIHPDECEEIVEILNRGGFDTVFFDTSLYGDAVGWIHMRCPNVRTVVHSHNFEKHYFQDEARGETGSPLPGLAADCERSALTAGDVLVFISEDDQRNICREYGLSRKNAYVIPPALADSFDPTSVYSNEEPYVLFLGSAFFGNTEAASFLLEKVAPNVGLQVLIAGKGMDAEFTRPYENAKITGYVPSLAGLMNGAAAFVSPVFSGSGSKVKIAEALMHGKYIIATEESLAGYDTSRMAVSVCRTADDFVQAIRHLDRSKTFYRQNRDLFLQQHEMNASREAYAFLEEML